MADLWIVQYFFFLNSFCIENDLNRKEAFSDASVIVMASCYQAVLLYLLVVPDRVMYVDVLKCKYFIIFMFLVSRFQ